jgi:hypothetical protein
VSWAAKGCLFLAGVFALAALAWMALLPWVVERELRSVTGFDVHVAVLTANPFTGRVVVRGLTANNPPAYPAPDFVQLRELRAEVRVFSWAFSGRIVVDTLDLDVGKIELVRRRDGVMNAGEFMAAFKRGAAGPAGQAPGKPVRYLVRSLRLRVDRLVVADYSGAAPDEKSYRLNIDQTYSNVSDPRDLLVPGVVRSLRDFGVRQDLARLLPGDFGSALGAALGGAAHIGAKAEDAGKKAKDYLKGLFDKLEQSPKQ